jgi:aryl-alcohol dehydrogenase-like predicted oxidoreductase
LQQERLEETRRYIDKIRDLSNLAEKLGCSPAQLSIAWSLKHEPVQCLLISGTTPELLHQSLQALQVSDPALSMTSDKKKFKYLFILSATSSFINWRYAGTGTDTRQ